MNNNKKSGNALMLGLGVVSLLLIVGVAVYFWTTTQQNQTGNLPSAPITLPKTTNTTPSGQQPATTVAPVIPTVGNVNSIQDLNTTAKNLDSTDLSVGTGVTQ